MCSGDTGRLLGGGWAQSCTENRDGAGPRREVGGHWCGVISGIFYPIPSPLPGMSPSVNLSPQTRRSSLEQRVLLLLWGLSMARRNPAVLVKNKLRASRKGKGFERCAPFPDFSTSVIWSSRRGLAQKTRRGPGLPPPLLLKLGPLLPIWRGHCK